MSNKRPIREVLLQIFLPVLSIIPAIKRLRDIKNIRILKFPDILCK